MEKTADTWKKYPLLVIGSAILPIPGTIELPLSSVGAPDSLPIHDFYLLLSVAPESLPAALGKLAEAQIPPEQILALLPADVALPPEVLPWTGSLEIIDTESPEEFRARLFGKLELQRQKKLNSALVEASESGIVRHLPETDLARVLDGTRIAHTLACAYSLAPVAHSLVLRACREHVFLAPGTWPSDLSVERMIVACAFLFLECQSHGVSFRDQLKERSASLPFRVRSELLHHIESSLGYLFGSKSRAA